MHEATTGSLASGDSLDESSAFREATLRSEMRRAYAVIVVLMMIVAPMLLVFSSRDVESYIKLVGVFAAVALLTVQIASVLVARWAGRRGRGMPMWFNVTTVVIESLVPTGVMLLHIIMGTFQPHASLSSPPVISYALTISLTTLRLRPSLCILAGAVSGAGYAALVAYVTYGLHVRVPATGIPQAAYVITPLLIFVTGIAAAWVAIEIRGHLRAALGEAETRRRMDRIERDLSVARTIQRALLPRVAPAMPRFDIAGWNRPADQTGGDYYDWQALPDGTWIVTLADVSGHGIGPALVTAACRAYMRASSAHHADLGSLATRINALLADDLPEGRFVTMASVLINPAGGPLAILSAGHGPIVLYVSATGQVQDILPRDLPLAVSPDANYGPAQVVNLCPGDVLALVTDGFVEWARYAPDGRREEFGVARLRESLGRHAHRPAAEMIEAVAADVAAFVGGEPQQDDLTMVVVKRLNEYA